MNHDKYSLTYADVPIFIDLGWMGHWSNDSKAKYIGVANNFIVEDVSYIFSIFSGQKLENRIATVQVYSFHGKIWLCHLFYCFIYVFEKEKRNIHIFERLSLKNHIDSY